MYVYVSRGKEVGSCHMDEGLSRKVCLLSNLVKVLFRIISSLNYSEVDINVYSGKQLKAINIIFDFIIFEKIIVKQSI